MRRSPLKRKKPLSRSAKSGSRTRTTKSRSSRARDEAYLARVRQLPCCAVNLAVHGPIFCGAIHRCVGRIHAHHAGRDRGVGQKASDYTAIPLCASSHDAWHAGRGVFFGMTREMRRVWADARIAETQRLLGRES